MERYTASLSEKLGWPSFPSCAFDLSLSVESRADCFTHSIGMALTFFTILPWQAKHYARVNDECTKNGLPVPPEARLPSMMVGAGLLPIGFLCVLSHYLFPNVLADSSSCSIFAWTSYAHVHWIAPMIGTASECASVALSFTCTDPSLPSLPPVFGYSMIAIYVGANSYIVDSFPEVRSSRAFLDDTLLLTLWFLFLQFASSAMASKTLLSRLCGGAIPMLCVFYSLLSLV